MRNKQRKRRTRRRARKNRKEPGLLERVYVDIVGPRRVPSLVYRGERSSGGGGGGNMYAVVFLEASTEYGFVDFIKNKDELEDCVERMVGHMEMLAQRSMEAKKGEKIQV